MQETMEAISAAAEVADRIEQDGKDVILTLSNGIRLRAKAIPPLYVQTQQAEQDKHMPKPPIWRNPDNEREEENPGDPEYKRQLAAHVAKTELMLTNLVLIVGTELVDVPEDRVGPDSDVWVDKLKVIGEATGQEFPLDLSTETKRYLSWLRLYALESLGDLHLVGQLPMHLAGLGEAEVQDAINSFRGLPTRGADNVVPIEGQGSNGDRPNRAARRNGASA